MRYLGVIAVVAVLVSAPAMAGALNSDETLDVLSKLTFGNPGEDDGILCPSGTSPWGLVYGGAYGGGYSLRYFDGGDSQAPGTHQIAYKNTGGSGNETISDLIPNKGPAAGSLLFDGTAFDGTALWLAHSVYAAGTAPAVGTEGADAGAIAMASAATQLHITPQPGTTTVTYYWSTDVYMPDHSGDRDTGGNVPTGFHVGPYFDCAGYGLRSPGGMTGTYINMSGYGLDSWHKFEMRAEFAITGQDRDEDDPVGITNHNLVTVTLTYFMDGVQMTSPGTAVIDLHEAGNATGPWINQHDGTLNIGVAFGLQRGNQSSAPEVYFDNITTAMIVPVPEPMTMGLLVLGGLTILRRRR